jgi:putative transposase
METRRPRRVFARILMADERTLAMPEHRNLPHLRPFAAQPIVFLTAVTHRRQSVLACDIAHTILREIWANSPEFDGWTVGRYVLMPDHTHLFARAAPDAKPLAGWIQGWKSLSGRRIAAALKMSPPLWQKNYFDRYLRSADNYGEKWAYVLANPVRKGLARGPDEWRWQGVLEDLAF